MQPLQISGIFIKQCNAFWYVRIMCNHIAMFSNALRSLLVSGLDGYGCIARMLFTQLTEWREFWIFSAIFICHTIECFELTVITVLRLCRVGFNSVWFSSSFYQFSPLKLMLILVDSWLSWESESRHVYAVNILHILATTQVPSITSRVVVSSERRSGKYFWAGTALR